MHEFIKVWCHISVWVCTRALLAAGLAFSMLYSASAQDLTVSEQTFGCILDCPKVRNTRFKHSDPEKLKEAMRIAGPPIMGTGAGAAGGAYVVGYDPAVCAAGCGC